MAKAVTATMGIVRNLRRPSATASPRDPRLPAAECPWIRSGRCLRARSTASMPLRVWTMVWPRVSTRSLKSFMLSSLSSTMSTVLGAWLCIEGVFQRSPADTSVESLTKENPQMAKPPKARLSTSPDTGMSIAVAALAFFAADRERLERFLGDGPRPQQSAGGCGARRASMPRCSITFCRTNRFSSPSPKTKALIPIRSRGRPKS